MAFFLFKPSNYVNFWKKRISIYKNSIFNIYFFQKPYSSLCFTLEMKFYCNMQSKLQAIKPKKFRSPS